MDDCNSLGINAVTPCLIPNYPALEHKNKSLPLLTEHHNTKNGFDSHLVSSNDLVNLDIKRKKKGCELNLKHDRELNRSAAKRYRLMMKRKGESKRNLFNQLSIIGHSIAIKIIAMDKLHTALLQACKSKFDI